MNRAEFLAFRDEPAKLIRADIRLVQREEHRPIVRVENLRIENELGYNARLNIETSR